LLGRAFESLLAQTEGRIEIVVADNCSADGTAAVCEQFSRRDPRIRIFRHRENIGMMENFSFVLEQACGDYFMWAAHDDTWDPTFVASLMGVLEAEPSVIVAMSAIRRADENGAHVDTIRYVGANEVRRSWWRLAAATCRDSMHHLYIYGLFRAGFLKQLGRSFPSVGGADRLFAVNVVMSGRLGYVDRPLYTKQLSRRTLSQRYADEALGELWRDRWWFLKAAAELGPYLLRSRTIPRERKALVPVLVALFARSRLPPASGVLAKVLNRIP
jgi:glycosyltransferase involved in cell wall biosynthesis